MVNYAKASELMYELGFCTEAATERSLMLDVWKHLKGDENEGVKLNNLKAFLCAI